MVKSKKEKSFDNPELKKKVQKMIKDAKKNNRIKPLSDAFKNVPVDEEEHQGKLSSYLK
jgi:hypothetical protein